MYFMRWDSQIMMNLLPMLAIWQSADFKHTLNNALQQFDKSLFPLQQGLRLSNRVANTDISFMLLNTQETPQSLLLTVLIFYNGIAAGDCCADDPTPICEQPEQCKIMLKINKPQGDAEIFLLTEDA